MKSPILSVSWLDGQLKAVAMQDGTVAGTYEQMGLAADFSDLSVALSGAASKANVELKELVMVLAHSRLSQQVVETPPAKGRKLEQFLQRRVQQTKAFDGEAAWSAQPALAVGSSYASLLHLLPKSFVHQLIVESKRSGLQLVKLIPATTVLSSQLKELPLAADELALVVAETGSTTTVVIGQKSGRVCLARVLRGNWNQQLETLAVELTRTIGFAEQETGLTVGSAWLFGRNAPTQLPAVQAILRPTVRLSPVAFTPYYWAEQAARLPDRDDGNLISADFREAPKRRQRLTVTSLLLLVLLLASLATAGFCELRRRTELVGIARQNAEMIRLQEQKTDWVKRLADLHDKKQLIRVVTDEKVPPLPAWFLGYLSQALPDELAVTDFRVARGTNALWSVNLSGVVQHRGKGPAKEAFRQAYRSLTNSLVTGPFHVKINRSQPNEAKSEFAIEGVTQ